MRGQANFALPFGGVVNDYVAFYFSPITAFSYTIHQGNVDVISPSGDKMGKSKSADRVFLVAKVDDIFGARLPACFSNYALNSNAPMPIVESDPKLLEKHVRWNMFDEAPLTAAIPEIGYTGVCRYFQNRASPTQHQVRSPARMAEFLVRDAVPTQLICGIITPSEALNRHISGLAFAHRFTGSVLTKPNCFL
jgi:hypothetical protein